MLFSPPQMLPPALYPLLHRSLKTLFPEALWELPPHPKKQQVALTFDDGPHPQHTPALLQVLQEFQVPATFFVLGERVQRWPHLVRQIRQQGHGIGLHGWQHRSFTQLSRSELHSSLRRSQAALVAACGGIPEEYRAVRPPNGLFWPQTLVELHRWGFFPVMWTVVPEDWLEPPVAVVVERVLAQVRPGSLIVLHDGVQGGSQVAEVVCCLIPALRERGLDFVRLPYTGIFPVPEEIE
ncbi:polysaccharide deacetylase family protein [Synechococcus sp. H70.2]|uniref:polysaccharide deacetylase family protein n=1 Tax=unclassified Synechococcus TaxID=2626047 RepID=UPI0039C43881